MSEIPIREFCYFYGNFGFFGPLCTPLPLLFEEEEVKKMRKRCKGEPCQKLAGFWREFHHFNGNFPGNLVISKFPKFPHFFGNSTKFSRNFGHPYLLSTKRNLHERVEPIWAMMILRNFRYTRAVSWANNTLVEWAGKRDFLTIGSILGIWIVCGLPIWISIFLG